MWEFGLKTNEESCGNKTSEIVAMIPRINIKQPQNKPINNRTITYNLNDNIAYYKLGGHNVYQKLTIRAFPIEYMKKRRSMPMTMEQARNWFISC
jgi:hypothetical protein